MAQPCRGSSARILRSSRSSVPCTKSDGLLTDTSVTEDNSTLRDLAKQLACQQERQLGRGRLGNFIDSSKSQDTGFWSPGGEHYFRSRPAIRLRRNQNDRVLNLRRQVAGHSLLITQLRYGIIRRPQIAKVKHQKPKRRASACGDPQMKSGAPSAR